MNLTVACISATEVIRWRKVSAVFWSVALQAVFLTVSLFIVNFNPWHPILWIQQSAAICVSFGTWQYLCILGVLLSLQGMVYCKELPVRKYCATRFYIFCNMFSLHNLCMICLHVLTSVFITYMYLSLYKGYYKSMTALCSNNKYCLVEGNLFLIMNGCWISVYYFIRVYLFGPKVLLFPVIQQLKFLQVKTELLPLLKQAMVDAVSPTLYFFVFYYWKGQAIRSLVSESLGYNIEEEFLVTYFGLMSLCLLLYSWFFSSIFIFIMYTMKLLFQVNLTEHIAFPVTALLGNPYCITLYQALAMSDFPIIQYLGYQDFKILAEKNVDRRKNLFTLSEPGGHPYNWDAIVQECLKLISSFKEDLHKASMDVQQSSEIKEHVTVGSLPAKNVIGAPPQYTFSGMRNMSLRVQNMSDHSFYQSSPHIADLQSFSTLPAFQSPEVTIAQMSLTETLKCHVSQAVDSLCKKSGICYIFGELPDARVRYHLSNGQPVIWAVEGLAYLAAASLKEDPYGIVQKDLPAIITTLLQLKQMLDKLQKSGNYKKSQKVEQYDMKIKAALRSAVKRSLYCISVTFGDYVKELPLTKEVLQQLQNFSQFREG